MLNTFLSITPKQRRVVRAIRRFIFLKNTNNKIEPIEKEVEYLQYCDDFFSNEKYKSIPQSSKLLLSEIAIYDQSPPQKNRAKVYQYEKFEFEYPPIENSTRIFSWFMNFIPPKYRRLFLDSLEVHSPKLTEILENSLVGLDFIEKIPNKTLQPLLNSLNLMDIAKAYTAVKESIRRKIYENLSKRNLVQLEKDLQVVDSYSSYEIFLSQLEISGELLKLHNQLLSKKNNKEPS